MLCLACGHKTNVRYGFASNASHYKGCPFRSEARPDKKIIIENNKSIKAGGK
jgi:hypothetical protein